MRTSPPARPRRRLRPALAACLLLAGALGCRATPPAPERATDGGPYLLALGVAQDGGVPQLACTCPRCMAARSDPARRAYAASALLVHPRTGRRWLFDATPDLREQVESARGHGAPRDATDRRPPLFDGIFLTHAHIGHVAGLLHLGREAYATETTPLYATPHLGSFLRTNGPWSLLFDAGHLEHVPLLPGAPVTLAEDLSVTPLLVPHRAEFSDTVAYRIEGPRASLLYVPDIDRWEAWDRTLQDVLDTVDIAWVDGTFFDGAELPGRDLSQIPHPRIAETLALLPPAARAKLHFFHLNHSNPVLDPDSPARERLERAGSHVVVQGQRTPL